MKKKLPFLASVMVVLATGLLLACGPKVDGAATPVAAGRAAGGPPPVSVTTYEATQRDLEVALDAIGTVTPLSSVEVRPQINSVVTKVHVQEGQFVRAGELLFSLDSRPDETNVAKMRAQLARDQAMLEDAQRQLARARDLLAKNFVSQGALDTSQTQVDAQLAAVAADRAAIDAALVALSYSTVKAPGAGRLGAVNVFAGTSVQANVTALVTVTQLDPISISFNLPQRHVGVLLAGLKAGGAVVKARLPDDRTVLGGRLQFVDNAVDAATGTVKVRARFDNRESKLWPGAFVNVSLVADTLKSVVVIPTAAIIQSTRGAIVYVAEKGKAALRPVQLLGAQGEEVAVTGVRAGDRVVLEGRQNLRPDTPLVERSPETKAAARAPVMPAAAP